MVCESAGTGSQRKEGNRDSVMKCIKWIANETVGYPLCVAHHNKDNIVTIIRFKLCDDRYAAYSHR